MVEINAKKGLKLPVTSGGEAENDSIYVDESTYAISFKNCGGSSQEITTGSDIQDLQNIRESTYENAISIVRLNADALLEEIPHDFMEVDLFNDSTGYNNTVFLQNVTSTYDSLNCWYKPCNYLNCVDYGTAEQYLQTCTGTPFCVVFAVTDSCSSAVTCHDSGTSSTATQSICYNPNIILNDYASVCFCVRLCSWSEPSGTGSCGCATTSVTNPFSLSAVASVTGGCYSCQVIACYCYTRIEADCYAFYCNDVYICDYTCGELELRSTQWVCLKSCQSNKRSCSIFELVGMQNSLFCDGIIETNNKIYETPVIGIYGTYDGAIQDGSTVTIDAVVPIECSTYCNETECYCSIGDGTCNQMNFKIGGTPASQPMNGCYIASVCSCMRLESNNSTGGIWVNFCYCDATFTSSERKGINCLWSCEEIFNPDMTKPVDCVEFWGCSTAPGCPAIRITCYVQGDKGTETMLGCDIPIRTYCALDIQTSCCVAYKIKQNVGCGGSAINCIKSYVIATDNTTQ